MKMIEKILLLLLLLAVTTAARCEAATVRLHATHTDAARGLSKRELLQRMAARSKSRSARLLSGRAVGTRVDPGVYTDGVPDTEYLVHMAIGTPPQRVQLILDTGSDLTWTQCRPCMSCFSQTLPHFDPSGSTTFAVHPCDMPVCRDLPWSSCGEQRWGARTCVYSYAYADRSITTGHVDSDTFTFANADDPIGGASVPGLTFGCGVFNNGVFSSNETGIAGFARGALSLPSQLKVDNFSYCFTTITGTEPSPVLLGVPANFYHNTAGAGGFVQSTALIRSPSSQLNAYYISLKGITVGTTRLPIPESVFALKEDGTGGTIVDSGTGMTTLPEAVYNLLRDAFVAQTTLPVHKPSSSSVSQLCFSMPTREKPDVPRLVLHLEGATLDLPRENYMFEFEEAGGSGSITCLAINSGDDLSIIGNFQQQNMHVLYDLANNMLSFVPAQCNKL
uniref:Peptidase A1 domain-containing protein n=1 Tax=Leersia perrieri TaxID=77586 RepID=A0A0D9VTD5_9ORYZ